MGGLSYYVSGMVGSSSCSILCRSGQAIGKESSLFPAELPKETLIILPKTKYAKAGFQSFCANGETWYPPRGNSIHFAFAMQSFAISNHSSFHQSPTSEITFFWITNQLSFMFHHESISAMSIYFVISSWFGSFISLSSLTPLYA